MAAHAGEQAWKSGTFVCQECSAKVRVKKGEAIPRCPNGHSTYDERVDEPRGQPSMGRKVGHRRKTARPGRAARSRASGGRQATRTAARSTKRGARAKPARGRAGTARRSAARRSAAGRSAAGRGRKRSARKSSR